MTNGISRYVFDNETQNCLQNTSSIESFHQAFAVIFIGTEEGTEPKALSQRYTEEVRQETRSSQTGIKI